MSGLTQFKFYKDLKDLKFTIRQEVIPNMPRVHKMPDAYFLKEHLAITIRLTAAIYLTDREDYITKENYVNQILYELYMVLDEIEEQDLAHVISRSTAAGVYMKIHRVEEQIVKFRSFLHKKRESDDSRVSEGVE